MVEGGCKNVKIGGRVEEGGMESNWWHRRGRRRTRGQRDTRDQDRLGMEATREGRRSRSQGGSKPGAAPRL